MFVSNFRAWGGEEGLVTWVNFAGYSGTPTLLYKASDRVRRKGEIRRHFQGILCGKKAQLCRKLCNFFSPLALFYKISEEENHFFTVQQAITA